MKHSRKHHGKHRYRRRHVATWIMLWVLMLSVSFGLISVFVLHFLGGSVTQNLSSLDWAGYIIDSDSANPKPVVTSISGSWIVPEITPSQQNAFSATWIGIGGQSDQTLIQTGTEQDSIDGQPIYSAWYEALPDYSINISEINISAGDKITASISLTDSATNIWLVSIEDDSTGQRFEKTIFYESSRLSAEWIVERPTVDNVIGSLAQFNIITFTNLKATVDGVTAPVNNFPFSRVIMINRQNNQLASVSAFSAKTSSFSVSFQGSG
jgi:Peptidase A4 family